MPAGPLNAPSSFVPSFKHDGDDFEPDQEWKENLRKNIKDSSQAMVDAAKARQVAELERNVVSAEDRIRLENEYKEQMADIKRCAQETYDTELAREINLRRLLAGAPLRSGWSEILSQQQRDIMNSIKQTGNPGVDNAPKPANDSPTDQRKPGVNEAPPHVQAPVKSGPPSTPQQQQHHHREEREKVTSPLQPPPPPPPLHSTTSARRSSDAQSITSRDRIEHQHTPTTRRKPGPSHDRPTLPDAWLSTDIVDEPEEMTLRPSASSRSNRNSIDRPPQPPPPGTPDRYDGHGSLGRSSGSIRLEKGMPLPQSPPKPEVWKPTVSPADDVPSPSPKPFTQIGRRPSSASIRSNASGASIRPSITETIPERVDDVEAIMEGEFVKRSYTTTYDHDKQRKSTDKVRDKEKRSVRRRDSMNNRPSPVDNALPNLPLRHDEPPLMSGSSVRSAGIGSSSSSATMQYAISPSSSSKPPLSSPPSSFASPEDRDRDRDRYHPDRPPSTKSQQQQQQPAYLEPRPPSRDSPYFHRDRELSFSVREGPPLSLSSRPVSARPSYSDERDFGLPGSRPISTKPAFSGDRDRDYQHSPHPHPPISHKSSFNYSDRREREREWDRDRDRDRDHWEDDIREREYARDREREREREREQRERESLREREREREREMYVDPRPYPYSSRSSTGSYPATPSSATRHTSHDYLPMGEIYDDRDRDRESGLPPRGYGYRSHGPPPPPLPLQPPLQSSFEDWEHPRESSRPLPSRQPSYRRDDRRDEHDRRMTGEIADAYPARYVPPPGSIPIPPRHTTITANEDQSPPAWTEWAAETGGRRLSDAAAHRHDAYIRSPVAPAGLSSPAEHYPRHHHHRPVHPPHSAHSSKGYRDDPLSAPPLQQQQPDSPTYGTSREHRARARARRKPVRYEYEDPETESDEMVEGDTHASEEESSEEEEDGENEEENEDEDDEEEEEEDEEEEDDDDDDDREREGQEDARSRAIEAETSRLMVERMEAEKKRKTHNLEIQRLREEEERLEQEALRKQEGMRRKEEEMARLEEEAKRREEEIKRKEEEEARRVEEARRAEDERRRAEEKKKREEQEDRLEQERIRKEEEFKKKEAEARKKELEAKRKVEAAKKLEIEASKKAEEAKKKEADLKKKEEQTRKREEKLKVEAEQTKKLQMEAQKAAEEAEEKQEQLRRLEEEAKKREEEIRERELALLAREEQLKRRESEAKKKEEEARKKEEERKQDEKRKEDEKKRQEDEAKLKQVKQDEAKREEATVLADKQRLEEEEKRRAREEERRKQEALNDEFLNVDPKVREQQEWILQQAKYEQQAEQIRRNREERKRNDSFGTEGAWPPHFPSSSPGTSPGVAKSPPNPNGMLDRHTTNSTSSWNTPSASVWTSSSTPKPSTTASPATNKSSTGTLPSGKPRTGSVSSGTYPVGSSPHAASNVSEAEWARQQEKFINEQQEKFRREQEKKEAERQLRSAGRPLTREEVQDVFKQHERLHARLSKLKDLTWNDFPWPLLRSPSSPDDVSMALVCAYFQSPWWPDKDKAKTPKDRIKEHLRRWHPDRFEVSSLPRVVENEREKVKLGAGNVVRHLSELLRKENENSSSVNIFGD